MKPHPSVAVTVLPERHAPALYRQTIREQTLAAATQATSSESDPPKRGRRLVAGFALAGCMGVMTLAGGGSVRDPRNGVPFPRDKAVVTAEMTGQRQDKFNTAGLVDIPAVTSPTAAASTTAAPASPKPDASEKPSKKPSQGTAGRVVTPKPECASCKAAKEVEGEWEVLYRDKVPVVTIEPAAAAAAFVVNVGTRIPFSLVEPVTTGATGAPLSGRVDEDVIVGSRIAIPRGALLTGEAYATQSDDRVQVLVSGLVLNGQSVPLRGTVLGRDSELGLGGKVIRKGSSGRRGLGRLLGAFGSALTFGLIPNSNGLKELSAEAAGRAVGEGLRETGAGMMTVSDKGIRVPLGTRGFVYLQQDLEIP